MLKAEQQMMLNSSTAHNLLAGGGASEALDLADQNLMRKHSGQFEVVANNVLDLFDTKYSCHFLGIHEQHDLYQANYEDHDSVRYCNSFERAEPDYAAKLAGRQRKRVTSSGAQKKSNICQLSNLRSYTLNVYDENKSGFNVLKRLITKTKLNKTKLQMSSQLEMNNCGLADDVLGG